MSKKSVMVAELSDCISFLDCLRVSPDWSPGFHQLYANASLPSPTQCLRSKT